MIKEAILNVSQFSLRQGVSIGALLEDDCPQYHQHVIVQCVVDPRRIAGRVTDVSSVKAQRQNWQQVRDFTIIPCFDVLWALPVAFVSGAPS